MKCIQTGTQLYQGTPLPKHLPAVYKGANRHKCWFSFPCYTRASQEEGNKGPERENIPSQKKCSVDGKDVTKDLM